MGFAGRLQQWTRDAPDRLLERSPNFILVAACSALFLDITNLSAITIALPTIQRDLGISTGDLQWVLSAYALTFGAFLLVGGRAGDLYSNVMLFGMGIFALFTLVCAVAPTFVSFVVARACQGIGAALTVPSAQAHIPLYFSDAKARSKALGIWGATGSVGFILYLIVNSLGLIIGGVLTSSLTWRWIFWMSAILSGTLQVFAALTLPRRKKQSDTSKRIPDADDKTKHGLFHNTKNILFTFDIIGVLLIVPALLLVTYALSSANTKGWSSPDILSTLILSLVLIVAFGFYESRIEESLVPTQLFRDRNFNLVLLAAIFLYAIRQASAYFLTLQLQSYGNSPLQTSLLYLPMGIASLILMLVLARLLPILGARLMLSAGWGFLILGLLFFSFTSPTRSFWTSTFIAEVICPVGLGAIALSTNFVVITMAPKEQQGAAGGILNVALQIGGSVVGLSGLTAVAQGVGENFSPSTPEGEVSDIAFEAVYYSCMILGFAGLTISVFAIRVPEALRGKIFIKPQKEDIQSSSLAGERDSEGSMQTSMKRELSTNSGANPIDFIHKAAQTGASLAGSDIGDTGVSHGEPFSASVPRASYNPPAQSSLGLTDIPSRITYQRHYDLPTWPLPVYDSSSTRNGKSELNGSHYNGGPRLNTPRRPTAAHILTSRYSSVHAPDMPTSLRSPESALGFEAHLSPVRLQRSRCLTGTLDNRSWYEDRWSPTAVIMSPSSDESISAALSQSHKSSTDESYAFRPQPLRVRSSREPILDPEKGFARAIRRESSDGFQGGSTRRSWRSSWKGLPTLNLDVRFRLEEIGEIIGLQRGTF